MNLKEIKELIELMRQMEVSELEIERSGLKVRIKAGRTQVEQVTLPAAVPAPLGVPSAHADENRAAASAAESPESGVLVRSPIVGTFYRNASPDGPHYVEVGDVVKKGQILCIVEAMKLMNEIESEVDGRVLEVLVENARPVEYGQPLFRIEPAASS